MRIYIYSWDGLLKKRRSLSQIDLTAFEIQIVRDHPDHLLRPGGAGLRVAADPHVLVVHRPASYLVSHLTETLRHRDLLHADVALAERAGEVGL